jgi:hypothetical protein
VLLGTRANDTPCSLTHSTHRTTGGWWHLNWGGRACGNGWCQIGGMSSNTSNTHGLMPFHCLRSSHYYEPSSPQQPPLTSIFLHVLPWIQPVWECSRLVRRATRSTRPQSLQLMNFDWTAGGPGVLLDFLGVCSRVTGDVFTWPLHLN